MLSTSICIMVFVTRSARVGSTRSTADKSFSDSLVIRSLSVKP